MRWILEVAYIGATTSWRWLLGSAAVAGVLIVLLFGIGVIGDDEVEGGLNEPSESASITPTPADNPTTKSEESISNSSTVQLARFISVPILATRAENIGSLEFELVYDKTKVELSEVKPGILSEDALIDSGSPEPGRLWAGIIDANGITGSGSVAVVKFKVKDNVEGTMALSLKSIAAYDANSMVDIITGTSPGAFNISESGTLSPIMTFH